MRKSLTYQKQLKLILITIGLFALVIYNFSIADTLELASKRRDVKLQVQNSIDAPQQIKKLKIQLGKIEQLIGNKMESTGNVHQLLLGSVTTYTQENHLVLKAFPQPFTATANGYLTQTSIVKVEGDFIPLLQLSNFIEQNYTGGKIVAINFEVKKNLRTRKRNLISTIYLQHVKSITNENNT